MSTLLSSTVGRCNQVVREAFAKNVRTRSKKWYAVAPVAAFVLAVACADETKHPAAPTPSIGVPEAPLFGAGIGNEGNGPGQCLTLDTDSANFINNVSDLNCTSEDVDIAFATITLYSVNGAPFVGLPAGQSISCVPGDNIRAVTQAFIENNAQERYDLGLWINPTSGGDAKDGSSCLHYNLIPGEGNSLTLETGGQGGTPDACGDVAAGDTVVVPLDTLILTCPGGGATSLSIGACAAWQNGTTGGNDRVCPIPGVSNTPSGDGYRRGTTPGTTAKCRCEPLVLPIDVKGVLRIEKQTLPDGAVQSFTFTPNYNSGTTFNLSDGQSNNSPPLSAGTYTVDETVPSGWTLGTRSCVLTGTATAKAFTSTTNGISVELGAGEDVTCTFNNTKIPTLTVNKVCVPTTDTGLFDLRIDGAVAGTGDDAACGGTTGAVEQTIGAHTVSEVAGTGTTLSNYTSAITGDCAADGSVTLAAGDAKVCTITNTRKPTLTVNKVCVPTTDAGLFNLRIDGATAGTGANAACGGTTGAVISTIGGHTVSETAGTSTSLTDYVSVISGDCAADGTVSLAAGDNKVCTITNTRNARLTVNKVCVPTTDTGLFNLQIDGGTAGTGANAACGGTTGAVVVSAGGHTVGETAGTSTNLANYNSVISGDCATDGSVTLAAGDNKTCTITNTRKPTLRVNKVCVPTTDNGLFDLRIDGSIAGTGDDAACGGTTGFVEVTIGGHTVSELAGTGTNLANYTSVIGGDCATDGTVSVAAGENKTCTITNTRKPTLRVNKVCVPTTDNGLFDLRIDGSIAGTGNDAACGGTTGFVEVSIGGHTVSELAGTGTNLSNYTSVIGGDCATDGTVSVAAGENKTCTITNTRKPTLRVDKVCFPSTDPGRFDLRIDGSVAGTGDDAACGGTTGVVEVSIGGHTVSELAGTGTNLSNYSSVISGDCAADGTVSLAAGQNKVCTITNTRDIRLTVNKVCVPSDDTGLFNLQIDGGTAGTGANAACGGTTGAVVVSAGGHTVGETAGTSTNLANYNSVISGDCAADGSITVAAGDNKTCTITNTRKPTLRVNKVCVPTTDNGLFDLRIDGSIAGTGDDEACGGTTGFVEVTIGSHTVSELAGTGTNLANYTSVIGGDCATDGTVSVAAGENKTCTITNTRKPTLRVNKVCVPTTDNGLFDLRIDGSIAGTGDDAACGGTTGFVEVSIGAHTVSELAGTGTDLGNYTSVIGGDCATDGTVSVAAGENKTCTITNTRKPTIRVDKVCVPTTDPGLFNLQVDAATVGTGANAACGGTTGVVLSSIGAHTVGETAGTNTSLTNYVSAISGDCAANGTINLVAGQNAVCTITNSRKAVLIVDKVTTGGDPQLFDFSQTGISNFQLADATTPKKTVDILPGNVTVCELALAVAWNVTATVNGAPVTLTIDGTTGNACRTIALAYGDSTTIVFTNTPPPGGFTRTIGYWKNWSSCGKSNGGQYERALARGEPEATLDYNLLDPTVYPIGLITSLNCEEAVNLLSKNAKTGAKRAGDPVYNMVAQLLGAKLNLAADAGGCAALTTALNSAQAFLVSINFNGTGSYKNLTLPSDWNSWAGVFGSYNEGTLGGGCPTHA